ncbi:MAG TPA: DUF4276 family protein [Pirellulales bacterium]|nr:DUF4276 family protein [Pirellulales bacterium]
MKTISVYVEGGGHLMQQRKELRKGLDALMRVQKEAALAKGLRWRVVPSGNNQEAYEAFQAELRVADDDAIVVLLVDSDAPLPGETGNETVDAQARVAHLANLQGWSFQKVDPHQVHLMVQCMEAWIVADPDALNGYYGKKFHAKKLPVRPNLEEEPKADLYKKLAAVTRDTSKGE